MANRWGNNGNSGRLYFLGLQNHCRWWLQPWNQKTLAPWKKSYDQPRQHIKRQRHYFANNGPSSQSYGFSSSHVWMWELDYKESWAPKNYCFWTVLLEKTLESPVDCKEIQTVHPKGYQSWKFVGRTVAKAAILLPTWYEKLNHWKRPWWYVFSEGKRRKGCQRIRWWDSITASMNMNLSILWKIMEDRGAWCATVLKVTKS